MAGDPFWNQVIFATHGGEDAGWQDVKSLAWPTFGSTPPSITTSQKVFGNNSFSLPSGGNSWVRWESESTPTFGTLDFTIDLFVRSVSINAVILRCKGLKIEISSSNLQIVTSVATLAPGAAALIRNNGWKHIAVERYGSTLTAYFGGVPVAQANIGSSDIGGSSWPYVTFNDSVGTLGLSGNIDECRVTMGAARYKGAFSVPTEPFPEYYEAPPEPSNVIYWN